MNGVRLHVEIFVFFKQVEQAVLEHVTKSHRTQVVEKSRTQTYNKVRRYFNFTFWYCTCNCS